METMMQSAVCLLEQAAEKFKNKTVFEDKDGSISFEELREKSRIIGSELIKRNDDNLESFKIRYNSFLENTKPLIEYYDNKNKLRKIDVNRNVEDIFKDIVDVII